MYCDIIYSGSVATFVGGGNRATYMYSVNIATFIGRRLCDIQRRLRHTAATLRHLWVGAIFSGVATLKGVTRTTITPYNII